MKARTLAAAVLLLVAAGCAGEADRGPADVLLITLDTTRADHLSSYGGKVATPHLDRLAADGVRFERASTSVPLTLPAHASILTGRWPIDHGVRDNAGFLLADDEVTLAEVLRDAGYATRAVIAASVLHGSLGIDQGFDVYDDDLPVRDEPGRAAVSRDGGEVVDRVRALPAVPGAKRAFTWVHFYDPHYPYRPPPEWARRYPDDPYAGEVAYVDDRVGALFDDLRASGRYDDTLIVVVGDHGEARGEHREPDHGVFVYESTLRVPLLLKLPGSRGAGGVVEALVRDIDVVPTVLDALGLATPGDVRGRSMLPMIDGDDDGPPRHAYAEAFYGRYHYGWSELRSLRDRRWKYIDAPDPELYDLDADPGETFDVLDAHPGVAHDLGARLAGLVAGDAASGAAPEAAALDPEVAARLRSLGYVGSFVTADLGALPDPKTRVESLPLFVEIGHTVPQDLAAGRYAAAIERLRRALEREPNYLDGLVLLGQALRESGDARGSIESLRRALALAPESQETLLSLARSHAAAGEHDVAADLAERVLSLHPRAPGGYLALADARFAEGDDAGGLDALRRLADAFPDSGFARSEIGRVHLERGAFDDAEREFREAARITPGLRGVHYNLALLAERRGDVAAAEAAYRAEVAAHPDHVEAWTNLGLLLASTDRIDAAADAFATVVGLDPDGFGGHVLLARARMAQGAPRSEVVALARRATELAPDAAPVRALVRDLGGLER